MIVFNRLFITENLLILANIYVNVNKYNLMKQILSFVFLLWFFNTWSQSSNIIRTTAPITTQAVAIVAPLAPLPNSIWFDYDVHGNQIRRRQVYLASNRGGNSNNVPL